MSETLVVFATNKVSGLKKQAAADPRYQMVIFTEDKYRADYEAAGFNRVYSVPALEDFTAVRREFARLLETVNPVGIIGASERAVQPSGFVRSYFGLEGPGFEECARLTDKYLMKHVWRRAGIPVADFQAVKGVDQFRDCLVKRELPLIVKPSRGTGAVDITVVATEEDRSAVLAHPPSYVMSEEYYTLVENQLEVIAEYHFDAVVSGGAIQYGLVGRYFVPPMKWRDPGLRGSYTVAPEDSVYSVVKALAVDAVTALAVSDGVVHCEVFETPDGFVVGEIAGRPGGGSCSSLMKYQLGVNIWDALVAATLRREIPESKKACSETIACVMLPEAEKPLASWTSEAEISAITNVDEVVVTCAVGHTSGYRHSSAGSGHVVYHTDADNVIALGTKIIDSFKLVYA